MEPWQFFISYSNNPNSMDFSTIHEIKNFVFRIDLVIILSNKFEENIFIDISDIENYLGGNKIKNAKENNSRGYFHRR